MFRIGCAEQVLEVPLFAELYGYGPFVGRRNIGVADPLRCRIVVFDDGSEQAVIVYTDTCTTCDRLAREVRAELAEKYDLRPDGIAFTATHTHSGPILSTTGGGIGCGEPSPEFIRYWRRQVIQLTGRALADREEIASADAGTAPLRAKLGKNRVTRELNNTDPLIRFVRFRRPDGSVKLFIHNHAMHGIAANGPLYRFVSSDWMGCVNALLQEEKLCDTPIYLQGPAGNINTATSCQSAGNTCEHRNIARSYLDSLKAGLASARDFPPGPVKVLLRTAEFPCVPQTSAELREDAAKFRTMGDPYWDFKGSELEEMALLMDRGRQFRVFHDLQYFGIGEMGIFFIPGELYLEPGLELYTRAQAPVPLLSTVSNGDGDYYFTAESAARFPDVLSRGKALFGYYEIYGYMGKHRFKYRTDIARFVVDNMLGLEGECR